MKIREGFVRNAKNLNSGTASARSLAVGTGGIVLVKTAATAIIAVERGEQRLIKAWSLMAKML